MDGPYSNPLPPEHLNHSDDDEGEDELHPMTNADFRKLLMTPASVHTPSTMPTPKIRMESKAEIVEHGHEAAEARKKKKSFYAKLKKMEEEKQAELAKKYRDRARERREGDNKDYADVELISTTANYRAVAPDISSTVDAAERRRQMIQESKFLGGDMEHTHLVRGLDYALLQKVRSEILAKEQEQEDMMEHTVTKKKDKDKEQEEEEKIQFRTKLGKNIYRAAFRWQKNERNELFLPRRMAYIVDLDDEFADSDIPTTLIRSKADCPSIESTTTLSTNDIVIQKLTQVLSYLRSGERRKKKKDKGKMDVGKQVKLPGADENIYADIGEYVPTVAKQPRETREKDKKDKPKSYFEKPRDDEEKRERIDERDRGRSKRDRDRTDRDADRERDDRPSAREVKDMVKSINDKFSKYDDAARLDMEKEEKYKQKSAKKIVQEDSYAECYPGVPEMMDAVDDSDDEVDYSKMDLGNKKGPVGRWDFDTQEEYQDYMSTKEALPKAAFQFGVKMTEGRKTRRNFNEKTEKQKLDQQWAKISNIIKRRQDGDDGSSYKRPKY